MSKSHEDASGFPAYTADLKEVIKSEQKYLRQRREMYGLDRPENEEEKLDDVWGLAISGGGIRSATLALGAVQKLIVEGVFKKFDYLATVSGGGYMGSCLTSLMHTDPDKFVHPEATAKKGIPIPGVEIDSSPFVNLIESRPVEAPMGKSSGEKDELIQKKRWMPSQMKPDGTGSEAEKQSEPIREPILECKNAEETRIDVRHQIHHLRTHGEYLTRNKDLFGPDVQRAIGTVLAGIVHNVLLFILILTSLVSLNFMVFQGLSDGKYFDDLSPETYQLETAETVMDQLSNYWSGGLQVWFGHMVDELLAHAWAGPLMAGLGVLFGLLFLIRVRALLRQEWILREERQHGNSLAGASGRNTEEILTYPFISRFLLINLFAGPILTAVLWLGFLAPTASGHAFWMVFALPATFSGAAMLFFFGVIPFIGYTRRSSRFLRSLHGSLRGASVLVLVISIIMPLFFLLLFSLSRALEGESGSGLGVGSGLTSLLSILIGYGAMSSKGDSEGITSKLIKTFQKPLLAISIFLFVIFTASFIAQGLEGVAFSKDETNMQVVLWIFGISTFLFILLGYTVNSNRLSLHYFYRDRLTEAYLKTDGRVLRGEQDHQGMPVVNLRNDEDLAIKDIAWLELRGEELSEAQANPDVYPDHRFDADGRVWKANVRSPYHLVVTALNLQGSNELVRKDLKSDHFVFARNYVGSVSTGFVRSDMYRKGRTKLARAMTISAAAVGSAMGSSTFFAQSFLTTLLNLRLGYWMENPWHYRHCAEPIVPKSGLDSLWKRLRGWRPDTSADATKGALIFDPMKPFTFWPFYLLLEMMAESRGNMRMVNLSDGGHTGDNLALLPLLRRRCRHIVVCDFEQDNDFTFLSLTHAIRMANIEENTEIKIDLKPVIPEERGKVIGVSRSSVIVGQVLYPDGSQGMIYYLKSSLSGSNLPVNVYNYHNEYPDFPHQSTGDQYFDDPQFEAYRGLGFHIAAEASRRIKSQR